VDPESGKMGWLMVGVVTGFETLEPGTVTPRDVMYIQYLTSLELLNEDVATLTRDRNLELDNKG
jgi:hypothetical protein